MGALTKRVLVAFIAIPLLLFLTFWDISLPFKIVVAVGLGLALLEYLRLADSRKMKTLQVEGIIALGFVVLPWVLRPSIFWENQGSFLIGLMILTLSFMWSNRPLKEMIVSVSVTFFGVTYFGVLGVYFFRLRELPQGAWHLLWLYIATWAYDTGGYFAGSFWGKHRLAPQVSPKKTWEGCLGGFVLVLAGLLLLWEFVPFYSQTYTMLDVLALSILLSFLAKSAIWLNPLLNAVYPPKIRVPSFRVMGEYLTVLIVCCSTPRFSFIT